MVNGLAGFWLPFASSFACIFCMLNDLVFQHLQMLQLAVSLLLLYLYNISILYFQIFQEGFNLLPLLLFSVTICIKKHCISLLLVTILTFKEILSSILSKMFSYRLFFWAKSPWFVILKYSLLNRNGIIFSVIILILKTVFTFLSDKIVSTERVTLIDHLEVALTEQDTYLVFNTFFLI